MISAETDGIGRPKASVTLGGLAYRRGVAPTPLEGKVYIIEKGDNKKALTSRAGWQAPLNAAVNPPRSSLAGMIGLWMRFWSRLSFIGVLQCPASGWRRLPWFLIRILFAVTLMFQAVASVSALLSLSRGANFFVSLQACEHFSLLSLLLPALSLRAANFRRALRLMTHIQTLPVFSDISLTRPRRRLLFVMVVACAVYGGLQVLHVAAGLISVDSKQKQGQQGMKFSLFPPVVSSDNMVVHYAVVLLQFVHVIGVYAANVLTVTNLHCINIFLYYHLHHLSSAVRTLLDRRHITFGDASDGTSVASQPPDIRSWTAILEAHSALWQLQGELHKMFGECGVLTHLGGMLDMSLTSYVCLKAYSHFQFNWIAVLMVAVGYMTFSSLCILFESMSADCVTAANAAIFDSNYGPLFVRLHPRELSIVRLIVQKTKDPMQLTAMNIFGITMGTYGSVVSLTVTYLIIIIQFNG